MAWQKTERPCLDGIVDAREVSRKRPPERDALIEDSSACAILGIAALATYWAWIFSVFHANVLDPLKGGDFESYSILCVIAAGSSAVSMVLFVLLGRYLQCLIDKRFFSAVLVVMSLAMGIPALCSQAGYEMGFVWTCVLWAVGGFSSSFVYLKTDPFLVWLRRSKLMRCIALAFLVASVLYLLALFLVRTAGVCVIMLFPVVSVVCSAVVNAVLGFQESNTSQGSYGSYLKELIMGVRDRAPVFPRTLVYALIFGVVSYTVLDLAVQQDAILLIGIAIFLSAAVFSAYAVPRKTVADSRRYALFLMPLIAVAVLPFPYVPEIYKVLFLAICIFGFTCFDAITWGDLADEIRDRHLAVYISLGVPTALNFIGIFSGWGAAALLRWMFGDEKYGTAFSVFSIVAVIALVLLLVWDLASRERSEVGEPKTDSFLGKWKSTCEEVAQLHNLTQRESSIFMMLARGRNQNYIADELVLSPHTVKTHTYHIYKKLDVHSQQELIDMVESRL